MEENTPNTNANNPMAAAAYIPGLFILALQKKDDFHTAHARMGAVLSSFFLLGVVVTLALNTIIGVILLMLWAVPAFIAAAQAWGHTGPQFPGLGWAMKLPLGKMNTEPAPLPEPMAPAASAVEEMPSVEPAPMPEPMAPTAPAVEEMPSVEPAPMPEPMAPTAPAVEEMPSVEPAPLPEPVAPTAPAVEEMPSVEPAPMPEPVAPAAPAVEEMPSVEPAPMPEPVAPAAPVMEENADIEIKPAPREETSNNEGPAMPSPENPNHQ